MNKFLDGLDELAGAGNQNKAATWLERLAFIFLVLMALSAPVSIAATQTAWLLGLVCWIARFFFYPRPRFRRTSLDVAIWAFLGWTVVTAIFSYAPDISIGKLRSVSLFLIFYFVLNNLRNARAAKFLASVLIFSAMWSVAWAPIQRIYGRGVEIYGVAPNSVFAKAIHFDNQMYLDAKGKNLRLIDNFAEHQAPPLLDGDAIVEVDGTKIRTPEELVGEIEKNEVVYLECLHQPNFFPLKVRSADLLNGDTALEKLGIKSWKHSRNWRFSGFYGQIITYAEVLQMIASLTLGLLIALDRKRSKTGVLLALCLAAMMFAFLLTFTRAAQAAFLASATAMVLVYGSRRMLLTLAAIGLPIVLIGIFFLQQTREVNVYSQSDDSINYRKTVYREGFDLWKSSARNIMLGVGMDSTNRMAKEWHLFDDGKLPPSHFHSTFLQILVERGFPALVLWLSILWIYGRMLIKNIRLRNHQSESEIEDLSPADWQIRGILLGCFGALVGFVGSSLVNYSLGDSEVAMVFYILTGIGVFLCFSIKAEETHS